MIASDFNRIGPSPSIKAGSAIIGLTARYAASRCAPLMRFTSAPSSGTSRGPGRKTHDRTLDRSFRSLSGTPPGDSAYGSAEMLGWLVYEHGIEPHVTVFDKSTRQDGTFSRDDFTYDHVGDVYSCPAGKMLTTTGSCVNTERHYVIAPASMTAKPAA